MFYSLTQKALFCSSTIGKVSETPVTFMLSRTVSIKATQQVGRELSATQCKGDTLHELLLWPNFQLLRTVLILVHVWLVSAVTILKHRVFWANSVLFHL